MLCVESCRSGGAGGGEGLEELAVAVGLGEAVEDALGGVAAAVVGEHADHAAQQDDLAVDLVGVEQLLAAGAGADDVDGREVAPLGQLAVEVQLHVAGALELLVDHLVHARAGVDQAGGDDGQGAALLDVARAAEELLGRVQRDGVDAAGQRASGGGDGQVVGAGEAGDGVEEDDDVLAQLDQALGAVEAQLGDAALLLHVLVEGGGEYVALDRAAHVGDLLGALADEGDHEHGIGGVGDHAVGDLLQHGGLAGLGGRDDEAALAQADGGEQVDHAGGQLGGRGLQHHLPLGEHGCQVLEDRAVAAVDLVGVEAVDLLHADEAEVALALLGRADLAGDGVAGAQAEAADLGLGDVDVAGAVDGDLAQEAVALVHDLEDAGGDQGLLGGGHLEDAGEQVLAVEVG